MEEHFKHCREVKKLEYLPLLWELRSKKREKNIYYIYTVLKKTRFNILPHFFTQIIITVHVCTQHASTTL